MATVKEANAGFEAKGLQIRLPYPDEWRIKGIELLEKTNEKSRVRMLLAVTVISDKDREISDLLYAETDIKRETKPRTIKIEKDFKAHLLPLRERMDFPDEQGARAHLLEAFRHLLVDKGYEIERSSPADLAGSKGKRKFFVTVGLRCDDVALKKAKELIRVRKEMGGHHDYGLALAAFQSSLGIPLLAQDRWISENQSYFANHRIGIYAVDNKDPNIIYPFSLNPKDRELFVYFVKTSRLWRTVKDRYVIGRIKDKTDS